MTVFWSDPTKIHLALPSGDEMEDEYYNPPATTGHGFHCPRHHRPGSSRDQGTQQERHRRRHQAARDEDVDRAAPPRPFEADQL